MKSATIGLIAAATAAIALPAAANAADWSGYYASVTTGIASTKSDVSSDIFVSQVTNMDVPGRGLVVVPGTAIGLKKSGSDSDIIYGGAVSWLTQMGNSVWGVELDASDGRTSGSYTQNSSLPLTAIGPGTTVDFNGHARVHSDWALRGKYGHVSGDMMIYGVAGAAEARVGLYEHTDYMLPAGNSAPSPVLAAPALGTKRSLSAQLEDMTGWTIGAGASWPVRDKVTFDVEARYDDYGDQTFSLSHQVVSGPTMHDYGGGTTQGQVLNPQPVAEVQPTKLSVSDWRVTARLSRKF